MANVGSTASVPSRLARLTLPATLLSAITVAGLALVAARPARATLTDTNQRLERIGKGIADPVAILPLPGRGRLLVAQRNGDLRMIAGDGAVSELLATVTVSQTCPSEGLLDASWHPTNVGQLYLSYIETTTRKMTIARMTVNADFTVTAPQVLYHVNATTNCADLGGALGWTLNNKLLVGTGDSGQQALASQVTSPVGKILRLNDDGTLPTGNALPNSPVYSLGVRNPTHFDRDPVSFNVYFVDQGPTGGSDELNILTNTANYGWPTGTGALGTAGLTDPAVAWANAPGEKAFVAYRPAGTNNFGSAYAGDLIVASTGGTIDRVDTNNGNLPMTRSGLFTPDAGQPRSWVASTVLPDGFVYLGAANGDIWRFRSNLADPAEPSARLGIVPLTVRKAAGGNLEIAVEREPSATQYGLYTGDLMAMDPSVDGNGDTVPDGLSHPAITTQYLNTDNNTGDAYARFTVAQDSIGGANGSGYILMSALVGSSRVDLQACKLEYSIVSPK